MASNEGLLSAKKQLLLKESHTRTTSWPRSDWRCNNDSRKRRSADSSPLGPTISTYPRGDEEKIKYKKKIARAEINDDDGSTIRRMEPELLLDAAGTLTKIYRSFPFFDTHRAKERENITLRKKGSSSFSPSFSHPTSAPLLCVRVTHSRTTKAVRGKKLLWRVGVAYNNLIAYCTIAPTSDGESL